jgi:hypothetical protein
MNATALPIIDICHMFKMIITYNMHKGFEGNAGMDGRL